MTRPDRWKLKETVCLELQNSQICSSREKEGCLQQYQFCFPKMYLSNLQIDILTSSREIDVNDTKLHWRLININALSPNDAYMRR